VGNKKGRAEKGEKKRYQDYSNGRPTRRRKRELKPTRKRRQREKNGRRCEKEIREGIDHLPMDFFFSGPAQKTPTLKSPVLKCHPVPEE